MTCSIGQNGRRAVDGGGIGYTKSVRHKELSALLVEYN